jgi:phosphotransferase system enzyme I (PtsI)
MQTLQGIAVSPGIAIGDAMVIDNEGFRIPRRFVSRDAVDDELARLRQAIDAVTSQIERNRDAITQKIGPQYGAIFSAHLQMLHDPRLHAEWEQHVRERNCSSEYAVSRTIRRYAKIFESFDAPYLAERAHDLFDIEKSLLHSLLGGRREELAHLTSPVIVLAHNLTPGETAHLDRNYVLGFVTEIGGAGGHTAIIAEALEIPAVVGTGQFLADVSGGETVIVDGDQGRVILQPDDATIAGFRRRAQDHVNQAERLEELRELPAETADGVAIKLTANIEFPHEVKACLERGAAGVGLYRTEFLYLGAASEPSEEDQFRVYSQVVEAMGQRGVVFRTLDLGADKLGREPQPEDERNPFLGLRSIRVSLRNLTTFRTQLRAILRASALGSAEVMFPFISTLRELRQAKMVLAEVMEDLEEEGVAFDRDIPVGMMVEVPAAVMLLDRFLPEVDFISIGTNDLIQYALAVDRSNNEVAELYRATDPAVLRLIEMSVQAAGRANVPANLCGQMSGSPVYTPLLLGMGLRGFSVPPLVIPEIKKICRSVTLAQCEAIATHAMGLDDAVEIEKYLRQEFHKIAPELVVH